MSQWRPFIFSEVGTSEAVENTNMFIQADYIISNLPDENQDIAVSYNGQVWYDRFIVEQDGIYLNEYGEIEQGMAWQPKPDPYVP